MSLINVEKTITLDVYDHDTTPSVVKTIQLDTGTRTVFAMIQNSRQDYDIGQNATVSLTVLRPDKTKVQITGQTYVSYTGTDGTMYGAKAELSDVALAVKGNLKAQFKITSGEQELRTEIFAINNGEALDAGDGDWAGDLDGHNLDEMAESIETLQTDMTTVNNDVSELKEGLTQLPKIAEPDVDEADLYVTDGNGYVLAEFSDGHIKTKNFDSSNIASGLHEEQEIDLSSYEQVNYNLENGNTWASSTTYKGVLIPASDLSYTNRFYSTTYKMRFAFLRSNEIVANTAPDYCMGTGLNTLNVGLSKYYDLPSDCEYVYVYVSDGTFFGQMGLTRMSDNFDVMTAIRNSERPVFVTSVEQSLLTAKHMNSGVLHSFVASNVSDNLLTFAHISDLHNDPTNYTRFLNLLNEHDDIIDFGVVSGDLVDSGSSANFAEMVGCESVLNGNVPVYKCMGNHETGMTLANIYTAYQPGSGDGSLYFSKDFSTQKIRVIFLNQYDNEASTRGNTGHYSQTQIDWFISQLSDAITNGLSVIVVLHSMGEAGWPLYNKHGFYQQVLGDMYGAVNSAPIVSDIINAFKHKKTLNKTYTYTDGDGSLNVNVTFSGYGKFICYIAGHEHVDVIGYSQIYPDQLICLVQGGVVTSSTRTEAQAHWQSKYDTPRVANTVTSDSINVYSIDTVQKLVKVVKVGSTVTDKFETRSFAVFGY